MRTPTWAEVEAFLVADGGWTPTRQTKHDFYEKVLPSGKVLNTHVSHAKNKSMHPDTFAMICRLQLELTIDEFWDTIRSGKSARTGAAQPVAVKRPPVAMLLELERKLHLSDAELEGMSFEEAKRRLDQVHSRP